MNDNEFVSWIVKHEGKKQHPDTLSKMIMVSVVVVFTILLAVYITAHLTGAFGY